MTFAPRLLRVKGSPSRPIQEYLAAVRDSFEADIREVEIGVWRVTEFKKLL